MKSVTQSHFPQVVFRNGKKMLWNPIERKPLVNRPEERVRLRLAEYLMLEAGWSKHRIGIEAPVEVSASSYMLRTDLIAYTDKLDPYLLAECKAESIRLTEKAAIQAARYNTTVEAPYLLITNGFTDFWFEIIKGKPTSLDASPLPSKSDPEKYQNEYKYWQNRGFCGSKSGTLVRRWITRNLPVLWNPELPWQRHFLDIKKEVANLNLSHDYRIIRYNEDTKFAITLLCSEHGSSFFTAILNQQQRNIGVSITNLDLVAGREKANTTLYSSHDSISLDIRNELPFEFNMDNPRIIENFPEFLMRYFKKHLSF